MARPERSIDPSSPCADLAIALRRKRKKSGISYSKLAKRANYGHTSLSDAAGGEKLPTWDVVLAFVRACDPELTQTEQEEWRRLWTDARDKAKRNCP